jgi:hypothetical protein
LHGFDVVDQLDQEYKQEVCGLNDDALTNIKGHEIFVLKKSAHPEE